MNTTGKSADSFQVMRLSKGVSRTEPEELIGEEPLLIRIDGNAYSVVMRTPGEEVFHAAGFCLGEGIADAADDFDTIGYCQDLDPNVIEVRLTPQRREKVKELLGRKSFVSQTSCGICGKELVKDLQQILTPAADGFQVAIEKIFESIDRLYQNQKLYRKTRGSHAAIIFDKQLEMIAFAEDVGRHNALDKAVGSALLDRNLSDARILVLSSRISYELVQKAARAHLPIMISKSRPTALAAEMGQALNMTLACVDRTSELMVFCGQNRIIF